MYVIRCENVYQSFCHLVNHIKSSEDSQKTNRVAFYVFSGSRAVFLGLQQLFGFIAANCLAFLFYILDLISICPFMVAAATAWVRSGGFDVIRVWCNERTSTKQFPLKFPRNFKPFTINKSVNTRQKEHSTVLVWILSTQKFNHSN